MQLLQTTAIINTGLNEIRNLLANCNYLVGFRLCLKMGKRKVTTLVPKRSPSLQQYRRISKRKTTIRPFVFTKGIESFNRSSQASICPPDDPEIPLLADSVLQFSHVSEDSSVHQSSNLFPISEEDLVSSMRNKPVENCRVSKVNKKSISKCNASQLATELNSEVENITLGLNISKLSNDKTSVSQRLALQNLQDAQLDSPNKTNYYKSNKIDYLEPDIEIGITIATKTNYNWNTLNTNEKIETISPNDLVFSNKAKDDVSSYNSVTQINMSYCFKKDQLEKKEILNCKKETCNKKSVTKTIKYSQNNKSVSFVEQSESMIPCPTINNDDNSKLSESRIENNSVPALYLDGNVPLKRKQTEKDKDLKSHKNKDIESQVQNSIEINNDNLKHSESCTESNSVQSLYFDGNVPLKRKQTAKDKDLKSHKKKDLKSQIQNSIEINNVHSTGEKEPLKKLDTQQTLKINQSAVGLFDDKKNLFLPKLNIFESDSEDSFCIMTPNIRRRQRVLRSTLSSPSDSIKTPISIKKIQKRANSNTFLTLGNLEKRKLEVNTLEQIFSDPETSVSHQSESLSLENELHKERMPKSLLKNQSNRFNKNKSNIDILEFSYTNDDTAAGSSKNQSQDKQTVKNIKSTRKSKNKAAGAFNVEKLIDLGKIAPSTNLTDIDVIWTVISNTVQSKMRKSRSSESKKILQHFLCLTKQNLSKKRNTLMKPISSKDSEISDQQSKNNKSLRGINKLPCTSSSLFGIQSDYSNKSIIPVDCLELSHEKDFKQATTSNQIQRQVKKAKKKNRKKPK